MKIRISQLEKERESITISNTNNQSLNASHYTKENHHFSESSHKLNSSNNKLLSSSIITESITNKEQTNGPSNINPNMSINLSSSQTKSSLNKHQMAAINSDGHTPQENNDMALERNRSRMITMLNRNCVDDLDSIYFFDKINMRANSASHNNIPKLNLNFLQMKPKKKEEGNTVINVNQSIVSQSLINNGSTMNIKKHAGVKFNLLSKIIVKI